MNTAVLNAVGSRRLADPRSSDEQKLDILVSTGIGRLHLINTARAIHAGGRRVGLITGWVPTARQGPLVNAIGLVLRQRRLFERLSDRRKLLEDEGCTVRQCPFAEAATTMMARVGLSSHDRLNTEMWRLFGWESRRYIRGARAFHVRSGAGGGGAIETARRRGMKVIADHSIGHPAVIWKNLRENGAGGPDAEGFGPASRFWRRVMRDCERADAVLVNSDFVKETMVGQGFEREKIHVAYLGIGTEWQGVKVEHRVLAQEPIRALFVGHFVKRKGSHLLIEAARKLRQTRVPVEFHIAGDAHNGPAEVEAQGIKEMFRFHGLLGRAELRHLLAESDMFVFPTLAEGCAKAAMEALSAGLPVITTRECGLPEAANNCVRLVPLGGSDALATEIDEMGRNRERRVQCGAQGAELVRRSFGPQHFIQSLDTFYRRILSEENRAHADGPVHASVG